MLTTAATETLSGAVIRHVLLAKQIPASLEPISLGLPGVDRHVRAGAGSPEQVRDAAHQHISSGNLALQLLTLTEPTASTGNATDLQMLDTLRIWVQGDEHSAAPAPLLIQLQGVLICVGPQRIALAGTAERMTAVTGVAIEFFWLNLEVSRLEQQIDDRWPELDEDAPAAFELSDAMLDRRERLQQRFQQMIAARALLARLTPRIQCPVIYPPTLASQAAERLREKSRLGERLEHLSEQLDVFERVYELCGQRLSDFISSRKSHMLEWIIVVLLTFELLLMVIDLLSTLTQTT
ncbi:MAG: hypothetical protein ACKO2P_14560 [Planctomycetota bacterium]